MEKSENIILTAITLIMYNDLGCDLSPISVIDGKKYSLNPNTLNLFKGFLDSLCQKINVADVIEEIVEVKTNREKS